LDILLAIPLLWAAYRGFKKGLVIELAGLAALILGIYSALHFSGFLSDWIKEQWNYAGEYLPLIAFAGTFIIVILLVHLLGKAIEKVLDLVALGAMNKIAGALFNIAKVAIILSVMIWFSGTWVKMEETDTTTSQESVLYPYIQGIAPVIIPPLMDSRWVEKVKENIPSSLNEPPQP
jgi:membrane protein required for colicin V production